MATGHGDHDRVTKHLLSKYANITKDAVEHLKLFSVVSQERRQHQLKEFPSWSALNKECLAQGQINLINMQCILIFWSPCCIAGL